MAFSGSHASLDNAGELHVYPKVLRSRGRQAAIADWVDDPKRPFTPPRPRPEPAALAGQDDASAVAPTAAPVAHGVVTEPTVAVAALDHGYGTEADEDPDDDHIGAQMASLVLS